MAEGSALQKMEQEITCPVCHDHFRDPKILPCLHYYCKECVQALADRAGPNRPFSCPECRSACHLSQNDPNQLPTAFFMNRLKELHSLMETADRKVEAICQQCKSGRNSEGFCHQCATFICDECMNAHEKMKVFAGHEVLTLDELKEAKKVLVKPPPRMCKDHEEQKKIYCFDCDCLICRDCVLDEHNDNFIKKATPQCREALVKQMTPLKATHKSYSDATDRAKAMMAEIETQNTENIGAVNQWIQEWMEIIQRYGHGLIDDMSGLAKRKIDNLTAQIKDFESDSAVVQSLEEFCEQNLENATDEEFIEIHKQILSRVEDECRKHKDANLELAEYADIGVELPSNESLNDLCHNEAKVVSLNADPASCTVNLESAEVNKSSHLTVCTLYQNGTPCKKPQAVEGELNSLVDGSLVHIKGTQKKEGVYEMVYTPRIRGRHQLAVTVNGEQVAGSPFTMCVKIPPTQLGTPDPGYICSPTGLALRAQRPQKPPYPYIALITMAIESTSGKRATLAEVCAFIRERYDYYRENCKQGWEIGIRKSLSLNDCFQKLPRDQGQPGKGHYWVIEPGARRMFDDDGSYRRRKRRYKKGDAPESSEDEPEPQITGQAPESCPSVSLGRV